MHRRIENEILDRRSQSKERVLFGGALSLRKATHRRFKDLATRSSESSIGSLNQCSTFLELRFPVDGSLRCLQVPECDNCLENKRRVS